MDCSFVSIGGLSESIEWYMHDVVSIGRLGIEGSTYTDAFVHGLSMGGMGTQSTGLLIPQQQARRRHRSPGEKHVLKLEKNGGEGRVKEGGVVRTE